MSKIKFIFPTTKLSLAGILYVFSVYNGYCQAPGCPNINAGADTTINCVTSCTNLIATVLQTGATTSYTVASTPYLPPAAYTTGLQVLVNVDDIWSNVISLPFNFCFYGNMYNKLLIGANGLISFDTVAAGQWCAWQFNATCPTPGPPGPPPSGLYNNSVMGAYHDLDPEFGGQIRYSVIGTAPCRMFVLNYYDFPHFQCNCSFFASCKKSTQQIVLYETTNVIEVYIQLKETCSSWNSGNVVIGIQNATGSAGISPPGRNTGPWTATNEAWRFTPSGTPNYTVSWYNPSGTLVGSGLTVNVCPSGTVAYKAEVVYDRCDGTQITLTDTVTVSTGGFNANLVSADATCAGCNGSATVSVTGGTSPFSYNIGSGSQGSGSFTGLCAGSYTVSVTDQNCTKTFPVVIAGQTALTLTLVATAVKCTSPGTITLNVSNGVSPYSYNWSNGQTTPNISGLIPGTYLVTVTDNNGCTGTSNAIVTDSTVVLSVTPGSSPAICTAQNGKAYASASGSITPYSYTWNTGPTADTLFSLSAGNYNVTATDQYGCTGTGTSIVSNLIISLGFNDTIIRPKCTSSNGIIKSTPIGGTNPYSFAWNTGQTVSTITGLAKGTYILTVTDTNGCVGIDTVLLDTINIQLGIIKSFTPDTCSSADGSAMVFATNGNAPYFYLWNNSQQDSSISGLPAGNYTVTATDQNGCTGTDTVKVDTLKMTLTMNSGSTPAICTSLNGKAYTTESDTTKSYTFSWSTGQTGDTIFNLAEGTYRVTATDQNGCTGTDSVVVGNTQGGITLTSTSTPAICAKPGTGAALIDTGTSPYTYLWSNGETTQTATALYGGQYSVTVTDANGCKDSTSGTVPNPVLPVSVVPGATGTICTSNLGTAQAVASSGAPPFTYTWSNGKTGPNLDSLYAGTYNVTVSDFYGCTGTATSTVTTTFTPIQISSDSTPAWCQGTGGTATGYGITGVAPYSFIWSNGNTNKTATGLTVGTYYVTGSDSYGCSGTDSVTITLAQMTLFPMTSSTPAICAADSGTVAVDSSNGASPFTYLWDNLQTGKTATGLAQGIYIVTVTDNNGCTGTISDTVEKITPVITFAFTANGTRCYGTLDGSASITLTGGTPPYAYLWSSGNILPFVSDMKGGDYTVTVTDKYNCQKIDTVKIPEPGPLQVTAHAAFLDTSIKDTTICLNGTAWLYPKAYGGNQPYSFTWLNQTSTTTLEVSPNDTTPYTLIATDIKGCPSDTQVVTVNVFGPTALKILSPFDFDTICANDTLKLNASATGGTGNYKYFWDNGGGNNNPVYLTPGNNTTYIVELTDGCPTNKRIDSIHVMVGPIPNFQIKVDLRKGCQPLDILFSLNTEDTTNYYSWNFGDNKSQGNQSPIIKHTYDSVGCFNVSVKVETKMKCKADIVIDSCIPVFPLPEADFYADPYRLTTQSPVVNLVDISSYDAKNWQWSLGDGFLANSQNLFHEYKNTGSYKIKLVVTNEFGCSDTAEKTVTLELLPSFYISNTFTPNNDGINDFYGPQGEAIDPNDFLFMIYNRWGELIYKTDNLNKWWDGKGDKGHVAQDGVYVWVIKYKPINGETIVVRGTVTLLTGTDLDR